MRSDIQHFPLRTPGDNALDAYYLLDLRHRKPEGFEIPPVVMGGSHLDAPDLMPAGSMQCHDDPGSYSPGDDDYGTDARFIVEESYTRREPLAWEVFVGPLSPIEYDDDIEF